MAQVQHRHRIGVFGGSFDPIHLGHLLIAESVREQLRLDEVRFIPAATAPHKLSQTTGATAKQRCEMVQLAIWGHPDFRLDDREIRRGGVSYTVDTLHDLAEEFPASELILIMGADSLHELHTWRQPERLCQLAFVAVVARGGQPPPDMQCLARFLPESQRGQVAQHLITMPQIEISATDIRRRKLANRSTRYLLPPAVDAFCNSQQLYREHQLAGQAE